MTKETAERLRVQKSTEERTKYAVFRADEYRRHPTDRGILLAEFYDVWKAVEYQSAYRKAGSYEIWIERI